MKCIIGVEQIERENITGGAEGLQGIYFELQEKVQIGFKEALRLAVQKQIQEYRLFSPMVVVVNIEKGCFDFGPSKIEKAIVEENMKKIEEHIYFSHPCENIYKFNTICYHMGEVSGAESFFNALSKVLSTFKRGSENYFTGFIDRRGTGCYEMNAWYIDRKEIEKSENIFHYVSKSIAFQ